MPAIIDSPLTNRTLNYSFTSYIWRFLTLCYTRACFKLAARCVMKVQRFDVIIRAPVSRTFCITETVTHHETGNGPTRADVQSISRLQRCRESPCRSFHALQVTNYTLANARALYIFISMHVYVNESPLCCKRCGCLHKN